MNDHRLILHRLKYALAGPVIVGGFVMPAWAQQLGKGNADDGFTLWRVTATLVFLTVVAGAAWIVVRKNGGQLQLWQPKQDRSVRVIETIRVSPQSTLCLIEYDATEILIAFTAQSATVISRKPATVEENEQ